MEVSYFRTRRLGPESSIEGAVIRNIPNLFFNGDQLLWTAGSLPIGAGIPDLIIVVCEPSICTLTQVDPKDYQILAYLRSVSRARKETIVKRLGQSKKTIVRCLHRLVELKIVSNSSDVFYLSPLWREILPEIVTVEVKVSNWRKAIDQAVRNRIFAHRSFIAIPNRIAQRIARNQILKTFGVGLLAVDDDHEVKILRQAKRRKPVVWSYYYKLASHAAMNINY